MYTVPFAQVAIMYAIIQATGRQVKVIPGGFATLDGTAGEPGAKLTLDQVLLIEKDGGEVLAMGIGRDGRGGLTDGGCGR